jgi:ABC-type uncharacterized transport system substrate-binding protein
MNNTKHLNKTESQSNLVPLWRRKFFFGIKSSTKDISKICILTPLIHPLINNLHQSFINTLTKKSNVTYQFERHIIHGTLQNMCDQIEKALQNNYRLIFSFGASCTSFAKEITSIKTFPIPIVFCGVQNPTDHGISNSIVSSKNHLTGLASLHTSYKHQVSLLLQLKPHTKNVLLVHNAIEPWIADDAKKVKNFFNRYNISVRIVTIINPEELETKITPLIKENDTLMILRDNPVTAGINALVHLCNIHGVTLFVPDLYSVEQGAAIGIGTLEDITGSECAEKTQLILEKKCAPHLIPITTPNHNFRLRANLHTLLQQGLVPHYSLHNN